MNDHPAVVVIGAGPAGLAMSRRLVATGVDHVVLERGAVARAWREERWDSLRLLTPNWMTRLPGFAYDGPDPDGYMTAPEVVAFLERYRASFSPPVVGGADVTAVTRRADGFTVDARDGRRWYADAVVLATGASSEPHVPDVATLLPSRIDQITALEYRNPTYLDGDGGVLVVGASASGVQIADELRRAGRAVTVAVGEHVRLPRTYRGRDVFRWMDDIGQLDERWDEVEDVARARRHASLQLVGTEERRSLDLNALLAGGVDLVGRFVGISGRHAQHAGSLANLVANADLKQARLLDRVDAYVREHGIEGAVGPIDRPAPTRRVDAPTELDLAAFSTVIWATGYRPAFTFLDPAARDRRGRIVHDGGVTPVPGLVVLGLPFLRRRRSALLAGFGADAADLLPTVRAGLDAAARDRVRVTIDA
jgi:putative flavoprotein involved in K+ transport